MPPDIRAGVRVTLDLASFGANGSPGHHCGEAECVHTFRDTLDDVTAADWVHTRLYDWGKCFGSPPPVAPKPTFLFAVTGIHLHHNRFGERRPTSLDNGIAFVILLSVNRETATAMKTQATHRTCVLGGKVPDLLPVAVLPEGVHSQSTGGWEGLVT